jgi:mRNA interferase MazF
MVDLSEPPRGREEGGKKRPALIISADQFNQGPADLVIVIPISSKAKGIRSHVEINPPEGGVTMRSFIKCETIRSVSRQRLLYSMGTVKDQTMETVEDCTKILLDIY